MFRAFSSRRRHARKLRRIARLLVELDTAVGGRPVGGRPGERRRSGRIAVGRS